MRDEKFDLTQGKILSKLLLVALPIMGTQFMEMAYNFINMFWLGRLSSDAVAASGTAGMYLWLAQAFALFGRVGAEIGVAQNLGRGDKEGARKFAQNAMFFAICLGIIFCAILVTFNKPLIGFFNIQEVSVVEDARAYLGIIALGVPFTYVSAVISASFNASGNTRIALVTMTCSLIINLILDPLLIFGLNLGIRGAAIATLTSQITVCVLMNIFIRKLGSRPFEGFRAFIKPEIEKLKQIIKWVLPMVIESMFFTFLSMLISRMVAGYGAGNITVQRVGSQIESMSYLIAGGFATALTAFVGQNYGAGKWSRIHKGFKMSIGAMAGWGVIVTGIIYFGATMLFGLFISEPEVIAGGGVYMRILALCQIASCIEITCAGTLRGLGKTLPSSIVSISCNFGRVLLAYFLSARYGIVGVWWAVTIGAIARGAFLALWFAVINRKLPKDDMLVPVKV